MSFNGVQLNQVGVSTSMSLGPLHTRAKSRDHEIERAEKKVFKGCPNTPPNLCNVVTDPKCSVKPYVTTPSI